MYRVVLEYADVLGLLGTGRSPTSDPDFMLAAAARDLKALEYAADELLEDFDFMARCERPAYHE